MARSAALALALVCGFAHPALALEVEVDAEPTVLGAPSRFEATLREGVGEVELRWDFGDGARSEWSAGATNVEHAYAEPGHYQLNLLARDEATPFAGAAFTHTVYRAPTATPAHASSTIVYDAAWDRVWNVNPDNDTVSAVDADAMVLLAEVPVLDKPSGLALAENGELWVLCRDDFSIAIVDAESMTRTDTLQLPYASQPMGIVIGGATAYVALQATGQILPVEVTSRSPGVPLDVGPWPRGLALDAAEETLYATRFLSPDASGRVTIVDVPTWQVRSVAELALDPGPDTDQTGRGLPNYLFSVAITPDGREAWVTGKKDNIERGHARDGLALNQDNSVRPMVASIDTGSGEETLERRLDLDDRNLPSHVSFSPLGDYAFVTVAGSSSIDIRDRYGARTTVAELTGAGHTPLGTVLDGRGRLFVHGQLSRTIVVYDLASILASESFTAERLTDIEVVGEEALAPEVLQGKRIFYDAEDTRMAREGYISCASCHFDGFEDGRVWDFTDRGEGLRNNVSLLGRRGMGHGRVHWSGNFDEIQDFEHDIRGGFGGTGFLADEHMREGAETASPLGAPKAGLSPELDALAAYVSSLDQMDRSPHRAPDGSLTAAGRAGQAIFDRLACAECHAGPDFTDSASGAVHDVGTLGASSGGRLGGELMGIDTPTLLGVWQTAPYLHDGSAPTLRDVMTTANPDARHGATSALREEEIDQLVAYLQQLDGRAPPEELRGDADPPADANPPAEEPGAMNARADAGPEGAVEHAEPSGCAVSTNAKAPHGVLLALGVLLAQRSRRSRRRRYSPERRRREMRK